MPARDQTQFDSNVVEVEEIDDDHTVDAGTVGDDASYASAEDQATLLPESDEDTHTVLPDDAGGQTLPIEAVQQEDVTIGVEGVEDVESDAHDEATIGMDEDAPFGDENDATIGMDGGEGAVGAANDDDATLIQEDVRTDSDATLIENPAVPRGDAADPAVDQTMVEENGFDDDRTQAFHESFPTAPVDVDPTQAHVSDDNQHESDRSAPPAARAAAESHYDLVENFARGGLGKIWRARDSRLRREVAYKELLPRALANPTVVERFLEEAQITGQLEHPGIVPIYDIGWQENGAPYYAMKLVHGHTFKDAITRYHEMPEGREKRLAFTRLLRNFVSVCQAIGFAHERGVLHRDLKPLNIMLGDFGETLVLDWGLAKLYEAAGDQTAGDAPTTSDFSAAQPDATIGDENPASGFNEYDATIAEPGDGSDAIDGAGEFDATLVHPESRDDHASHDSAAFEATIAGDPQSSASDERTIGDEASPPSGTPVSASVSSGASKHDGRSVGEGATHGASQGSQYTHRPTVSTDVRSRASQTMMGSVMGTPAYMPPEQAEGRHDDLDARTDNYSLGAILYEILVNRPPIAKGKVTQMLKDVKEGNFKPPREIDPVVPKPLEAVCLKALSKKADDRYATAMEIAAEVESWLADEPVAAYPEPWYHRLRRWSKRHRTLVTTTAAAIFILAGGWFAWSAVETRRVEGLEQQAQSKLAESRAAAAAGEFDRSAGLLREAAGLVTSEERLKPLADNIGSRLEVVEDQRLESIRKRVNERMAEVNRLAATCTDLETPAALDRYGKCQAMLRETLATIEDETELASLSESIDDRIGNLQQLADAREERRVATVEREAEDRILQASRAIETSEDYDEARTLLTGVVTMLADEPKLAAIQESAKQRLEIVEAAVAARAARTQAIAKFNQFEDEVDQARFFGSLFTGESVEQDSKEAQQHAQRAIEMYGLEKADGVNPPPANLPEENAETIRNDGYEMMLILAETGRTLARAGTDDERREAATEALSWIERAKKLGVVTRAALLREAAYLAKLGRDKDRNAVLEKAEGVEAATTLDHFLLAEDLRKAEKYEEALVHYRSGLQVNPNDFWSLHMMGLCHLQRADPAAADASYTAAIARRPEFAWNYIVRGVARGAMQEYPQAMRDFATAEKLDRELYGIYQNRGAVYLQQKKFDEAVADFKTAIEHRPNLAGLWANLGEAYRLQEKFQDALGALTKAASLAPNTAAVYRIRGDVHMRLQATDQAIDDFKRAAQLESRSDLVGNAYKQIGLIHHRAERMTDALDAYDKSVLAYRFDPEVFRLRAEILNELGNRDEDVLANCTRYLEMIGPDADLELLRRWKDEDLRRFRRGLADVYRFRGLIRAKLGRYREAMDDYTRALEVESAPNMLARRGWAYLLKANNLALADFDESVKQNPQNADSYIGRGYAKSQLGDYLGAVADAEEGVKVAAPQIQNQGAQTWPLVFNAATIYGQAVAAVEKDKKVAAVERTELTTEYTERAVELIQKSAQIAGRQFQPHVAAMRGADPALDPIRDRPEFQKAFGGQGAEDEKQ